MAAADQGEGNRSKLPLENTSNSSTHGNLITKGSIEISRNNDITSNPSSQRTYNNVRI